MWGFFKSPFMTCMCDLTLSLLATGWKSFGSSGHLISTCQFLLIYTEFCWSKFYNVYWRLALNTKIIVWKIYYTEFMISTLTFMTVTVQNVLWLYGPIMSLMIPSWPDRESAGLAYLTTGWIHGQLFWFWSDFIPILQFSCQNISLCLIKMLFYIVLRT